MFAPSWFARAAGFVALIAAVGCGGGGSNSLATVSGKITHNGSPLDGAKVTFFSTVEAEGKRGNSYAGLTDSQGKYLIAGFGTQVGIPPGMYKVTITKPAPTTGKGNLPAEIASDPGQMMASGASTNLLPKEFENEKTTKLSATLQSGRNDNVNFDMKGQGSGTKVDKAP